MQRLQVKLTLKVLSPENSSLGFGRGRQRARRQQNAVRLGEHASHPRGLRPDRASKHEHAVTREIHRAAHMEGVHWESSLESEKPSGARLKSEASVVAMKLGNASGAKGWPEGDGIESRHGPDTALVKL